MKPKKCPKCGVSLESIIVEEHDQVTWNDELEGYESGGQATGVCKCPQCGEIIGGYGQQNWGIWPETV